MGIEMFFEQTKVFG